MSSGQLPQPPCPRAHSPTEIRPVVAGIDCLVRKSCRNLPDVISHCNLLSGPRCGDDPHISALIYVSDSQPFGEKNNH